MATPWDEYLKKRKASEESVGNDGATSWEDYKKKRGLTFASANTNSGIGGEQQQPGIQIPKPKGFATPMLRTASATQREAQALNLPQRQYIPHEMNPINPKNSRDMTGKSNVVTGAQMIQHAQQTQKQDSAAQAILTERDLKQKSVDNSPTGVPPRSAAKTETQPLVGMANTVLSVQQSSADQQSLVSELQQFQHGQPMNAEQVTAYGDRATALKRDADYSLAWLEKNKSRISEQEYTSLKNHYAAQKQNADYALSIVNWYKEGHSAKVFSEIPSLQQSFVDGTADFEGIGARADELHAEIYSLEEKRQDYQRTIQNLSYEDEPAIIAERQRIQTQLDAVNQQIEVKRSELQVERDRLSLLNTYTKGYQEQDPQAADKVAKGKAAYEAATSEMDAQYKDDYRVTGVQKNEKQFSDINALNAWLQGEWQDIVAEGGADLVTTRNLVNGEYMVTYTVTNDRFLNEAAAMLDARTAYPTAISLDHMNDKQKDTYYYLLGAGYDAMAISYANECARATKNRKSQNVAGLLEDDPTQIIPATVAYSLLFPFAGYDIAAGSRYLETGLDVNPQLGVAGMRDAIVSGASNWMNSAGTLPEGIPVIGGKGLGDVYSTVLSGAESYGAAMAFGQFATIPLALSAASSTYNNAVARGIPEEDAKLEGLAAGGAEALFEYVSIGEFIDGKTSGSIIKDILKQGAVEGSEEVLTGIANHVTDGLINKDNSQFNQNIDRLMAEENLSYDEARDRVSKQLTSDLIFEGLIGFATGSTMSIVKTVGLYRSADSVIAARGNTEASVADRIRAEQAYVAAGVEAGDSATQVRAKVAKWIQDGAHMTLEDQAKGLENYTEAKAKEASTQRDDSAQEVSPDSTVIQSEGTQAYLDLGLDLATAKKAGVVLDGIVKGEITAENMTSNQARALQLNTQIGVDAVRKVLGVEIKQRANSVANGGVMAKAVVQQYEQNKAVATPVSQAQQTAQTMSETAEGQNVEAAQAQEMPQTAQPVQQPVQQPAAEQPRPIPRADAVANTVAQRVAERSAASEKASVSGNVAVGTMDYSSFKTEYAEFGKADKNTVLSLHDLYVDAVNAGSNVLTPAQYAEQYRKENPKAKKKDIAAAYRQYLESENARGETRQSTKTGTVGLERNEYSEQLDKAVTDAVDSLGKLFGLRIRFADLGTDNGYYTIGTNDVVLDIAPSRAGIGKENAFRFVIAHEIGHAAKDRLGAERWQQFEDYAVKIMGGENAITAKQQEGKAYADKAVAREDVACDFIGQLLSDKATLDNFCGAIRSGEVQKETARGFMATVRKILGKLRGKGIKQFDAATKQLAEKAAKQFGTELETAENAVKAMQQVLSEAARAEKNTTAASPLSGQFNEKKSGNEKLNIDNAEKSSYNGSKNKNGGDQYDGNRVAGEVDRGRSEGREVRTAAETGRNVGRGYQVPDRVDLSQSLNKAFEESGVVATELYDYSGDSAAYSSALDAARNADEKNGWCVTPQSPEELKGKKLRMDAINSIGYVLSDGDIEGVFKNQKTNSTRRALNGVIPQAIAEGGTKLDCYGEGLVRNYERFGFIPVARVEFNPEYANPGWDESKGRPFIYMMMHNGDSADTVVRNIGQYDHLSMDQLQSLPTYDKDGYDEAAAYRDSLLESSKKRLSKKTVVESKVDRLYSLSPVAKQRAEAATTRKSTKDDMVKQFGKIEPGETPVRESNVPKRTEPGNKVSKTVRTAVEAGVTPDALVPEIDEAIVNNLFSYTPETNKARYERVKEQFGGYSIDEARDSFNQEVAGGKVSADTVAKGILLYNHYATESQKAGTAQERRAAAQKATRTLADLSAVVRSGAQATQMVRMLKRLSPEMKVYSLEHSVKRLQEHINERYGDKSPKLQIDEELAAKWVGALNSGDKAKANDAEDRLLESIARQVPKTFMDRWNAWRYTAMLGNAKTLIRNFFGNALFMPLQATKNATGAAIEAISQKVGWIDKSKRTKSFGAFTTKKGRALLDYAKADFATDEVSDILEQVSVGKYRDGTLENKLDKAIQEYKNTFQVSQKNKLAKVVTSIPAGWQKVTNYVMNDAPVMSDKAFQGKHYRMAFAQAAMARGYTAEMLQSGKVSDSKLNEIREYAARQAAKATYRDANMFSKQISKMRFKGKNLGGKIGNVVLEGILPFRATPMNVLVRAVEYSPVGLFKALAIDSFSLASGKISATEYMDRLTSGLTGSALFALGAVLSSLGVIRLDTDEDDEREGRQNYSLEIGSFSVTLDWLAPAAIPFFMGAEIQQAFETEEWDWVDALGRAFEPMLEMSMLSGISDVIDTMTFAAKDGIFPAIISSFFVQPFISYVGQAVPTLLGQFASSFEPKRTSTYVGDIKGSIARNFVRSVVRVTEKIPFVDWRQIDYVDTWGREDGNEHPAIRFFNNFINPAYVSVINQTDADSEIRRLEEATGSDISPTRRGYTITVSQYDEEGNVVSSEKVSLNGEQYEAYSRAYGEQAALMIAALMSSDYYDTLSDDDKVKAFSDIESLADKYGKLAAGVGYVVDPTSSDHDLYELVESGVPVAEAYCANLYHKQLKADESIRTHDKPELFRTWVLNNPDWTDEQKAKIIENYGAFSSGYVVKPESYDEMIAAGISADAAIAISTGLRDLEPEGDAESVTDLQRWTSIIDDANANKLSDAETDAALRIYMSEDALAKYDVCSKAGVTARQYVAVAQKISNLKPLDGAEGITDAQKVAVCIQSVENTKAQDALIRRYLGEKAEAKYDAIRKAGVTPSEYSSFISARDTYAEGSWSKSELRSWLRSQNFSDEEKAAIWAAANSAWGRDDPNGWRK